MRKLGFVVIVMLCGFVRCLCSAQNSETVAPITGGTSSISTLPNWTYGYSITGFGDQGGFLGRTVGQTFRVAGGTVRVTSMQAPVFDRSPQYTPYPSDFQIGVAAWDGARPTGPLLYLSDHLVAYDSTWRNFIVAPDNLILNAGQDYVLFFTPMNYLDGRDSYADMGPSPMMPTRTGTLCRLWCSLGTRISGRELCSSRIGANWILLTQVGKSLSRFSTKSSPTPPPAPSSASARWSW